MSRRSRVALAVAAATAAAALGALLLGPAAASPDAWMHAAGLRPLRAAVGRDDIRYVRVGTGPPVVLVHGIGSSIYTWKDVIPELARGHEVVALDLPGFGGSSQPGDLSFPQLPAAVLGLADQLGLERFALVGHSLGGAVATILAAEHADRITHLALFDAAGYNLAAAERPLLLRFAGSPPGVIFEWVPTSRPLVAVGLWQVFEDDALVDAQRVEAYLAPLARPGAAAAFRSLLVSARDDRPFSERARSVRAPALVVWGRDDRWTPVEQAASFGRDIAGARVEILDRCGHMPQEERPDDVRRLLQELLAQAPSAGGRPLPAA